MRSIGTQESQPSASLLEEFMAHTSADFHNIRNPETIRLALLKWYDNNRRKLPWRGDPPPWTGSTATSAKNKKTHGCMVEDSRFPITAYGIWVTEIMCQQTRVEAVIPYWLRWMKSFPSVHDLARASDEQVNAHWAGLGFYRRARLLHSAAKYVVNELDGEVPRTMDGLLKLSGVGRYTAGAIASIAYNVTVPAVDGNVCRVLSRLSLIAQHIKAPELKDKWAWHFAQQIVEAGDGSRPGCVNSALMELGATYCAPSGTGMEEGDPLKDFYLSTKFGNEMLATLESRGSHGFSDLIDNVEIRPERCPVCARDGVSQTFTNFFELYTERSEKSRGDKLPKLTGHEIFPLPPPKIHKREEVYAVAAIYCYGRDKQRRWLLVRRPSDGLLANQWEFPAAMLWNSDNRLESSPRKRKLKREDMSNNVPYFPMEARKKALDDLLISLCHKEEAEDLVIFRTVMRSQISEIPIEHIFSHVRHTMWIEQAHLDTKPEMNEWVDAHGRHVRWMSARDMDEVGVTSAVKKILKAVEPIPREKESLVDGIHKQKRIKRCPK